MCPRAQFLLVQLAALLARYPPLSPRFLFPCPGQPGGGLARSLLPPGATPRRAHLPEPRLKRWDVSPGAVNSSQNQAQSGRRGASRIELAFCA